MLDSIRSNAQSFGVKVAFGIIILVFVFWGVGSLTSGSGGKHVAMVNGSPISARDFELRYRDAEENLRRSNPDLLQQPMAQQQLGHEVLRDLVFRALLTQEAERMGITVTPLELRMAIGEIKAFQDSHGNFDPEAYKRLLAAQRMSPAQFEQDMSNDLLKQKIFSLVTAAAWVDPQEARHWYDFLRERRSVEYAFVPAADYLASIQPSASDVQAYYDTHKPEFAVPAKVNLEYVLVGAEALGKADPIGEEEAAAWYEENRQRFSREEEVKVAHILVPLAQDASGEDVKKAQERIAAIRDELAQGKDFAAVADAHNGPNAAGPGGDVGWIRRGMTVPPFEEAAFALEPGKVSDPVRSQFGLHLIQVADKHPAGVIPFKDALADVRRSMALERGERKLHDVLDELVEANILGKSLQEQAAKFGLESGETGLCSAAELEKKLQLKPADAASLLALTAGSSLDTVLEAGDAYLVARALKKADASTRPLEQVREDIVKSLKAEQALARALSVAGEKRKSLADGPLAAQLKKSLGLRDAVLVERDGPLAAFAPNPELNKAIFAVKAGSWLPAVHAVTSEKEGAGAVLVYVSSVQAPDESEWESVREMLSTAVTRERAEGFFALFMQRLLASARIEVLNQSLVERKNM
jgi:peptidyl-prolyl cis-trans isomerase D